MPDSDLSQNPSNIRQGALSRWDNEGGAIALATQGTHTDVPTMSNAELVQLRIRVIALENLMIAVLAEGTDRQRKAAHYMADYISPRSGFTHHPLTLQAADHMTDLVSRAVHFQQLDPS